MPSDFSNEIRSSDRIEVLKNIGQRMRERPQHKPMGKKLWLIEPSCVEDYVKINYPDRMKLAKKAVEISNSFHDYLSGTCDVCYKELDDEGLRVREDYCLRCCEEHAEHRGKVSASIIQKEWGIKEERPFSNEEWVSSKDYENQEFIRHIIEIHKARWEALRGEICEICFNSMETLDKNLISATDFIIVCEAHREYGGKHYVESIRERLGYPKHLPYNI